MIWDSHKKDFGLQRFPKKSNQHPSLDPSPGAILIEIGSIKIGERDIFEAWLKLPGERTLRNLQRWMLHVWGFKPPLSKLAALSEANRWRERAAVIELSQDAEINREAFLTLKDRMVRRRAETLDIIAQIGDKLLRDTAKACQSRAFTKAIEDRASPFMVGQMINNLLKLAALQERVLPVWGGPAGDPGASTGDAGDLLSGPINPLDLALGLQALARRKPLLELRAAVEAGGNSAKGKG